MLINDSDLKELCFRMQVVLTTIENAHCEGRWLPRDLFDQIDTLESLVLHGPAPSLAEWTGVIREFGEYYRLDGSRPIEVDAAVWQETVERFQRV
jgi:hypothetical protein